MSVRPYVSIDIETTGVDTEAAQVLEIGAVLDDGGPIESLPTFQAVVHYDSFSYATPYAMNLNQRLLKMIAKGEGQDIEGAFKHFLIFLSRASEAAQNWDENTGRKPSPRFSLAGKNAANFDIPILDNQISLVSGQFAESFRKMRLHRVVDVGSMYLLDFGYIPTLEEIKRKIGIGDEVSHKALDDAMDVVKAIRAKR